VSGLTLSPIATTVQVEFDGELLSRLRARHPGKTDRELLERLAVIELGMAALRASQARNSDPEEVVLEEAVRAVREVRAEMRAERG
jgi:hypothetical protein